jgi:arylsulfotransferase ASST
VKFRVAAALGTVALCAAVVSCSPGSAATASTQAPAVTVLTRGAGNGNGDIFLAPQGGQYGSGPEIVSITGKVLWFHPLPAGTFAADFRTQAYLGKPVLTWFQISNGAGGGEGVIYNARYQQIATVKPANGYAADFHEFFITPWNTALILADRPGTVDLTSLGLSAHQPVNDGVVQEIDIKTGKLLFQWDSAGEIFAFQHDPEALGGNVYTVFDDESHGQSTLYSCSRAATVSLDLAAGTATLIKSVNQPEGLTAAAAGSAQTTKNGDLFVSWGGLSYFSEFSPSGKLLFNAKLPDGVGTYRAYRLPWNPGSQSS